MIIPTHNRATQVLHAVDSVLAQDYSRLEIVLVDDGSTDNTAALVRGRYGDDSRVRYLHQEQSGVAAARNQGLAAATGELIAFLDSDDIWLPGKLALQLECLNRVPQAGMLWTDVRLMTAEGKQMPGSSLRDVLTFRFPLAELFDDQRPLTDLPHLLASWREGHLYVGDIYAKMVLGNLVMPSTVVMTRERLERVGQFDESLQIAGEDFDFFLRACRAGPVAFADVPTVLYQVGNPDQLTDPSRRLFLARNYLRTLERALSEDRERIDLPPALASSTLARAHSWVAQSYLEAGDGLSARPHLRVALAAGDRSAAGLALVALLPQRVRVPSLALARRCVHLARGRGALRPGGAHPAAAGPVPAAPR